MPSELTKLTELPVSDDKRAKSPKPFQCLVSVLFSGLLANWSARKSDISTLDLLRLPNEILEQIALVLGKKQVLGLLNNRTEVGDQGSTFGREFLRWVGHWARLEEAIESNIDLLVLQTRH